MISFGYYALGLNIRFTWLVSDVMHGKLIHVENDGRLSDCRRREAKSFRLGFLQIGRVLDQRENVGKVVLLPGRIDYALQVGHAVTYYPN